MKYKHMEYEGERGKPHGIIRVLGQICLVFSQKTTLPPLAAYTAAVEPANLSVQQQLFVP